MRRFLAIFVLLCAFVAPAAAVDFPQLDGRVIDEAHLLDPAKKSALENKLVFGTMNRGGLMGAAWELDDRMTAYDADSIADFGLDGGKVLLRIADDDAATAPTLEACGR